MAKLKLHYLGGHPEFPKAQEVTIERLGHTLKIAAGGLFGKGITIPLTDIQGLTMQKGYKRSVGKAAAGAIIGGVLTGGVGAIAGAAIGGRSRDNSVIVLTVDFDGMSVDLLFTGNNAARQYSAFSSLIH